MTHDLSEDFRTYEINVTNNSTDNCMEFEVAYDGETIQPGGSWVLSYVIGAHAGDWHVCADGLPKLGCNMVCAPGSTKALVPRRL